MIASILLLAIEYSAGIGLARNTPEPRGNPFWAPRLYIQLVKLGSGGRIMRAPGPWVSGTHE